jgi:RNA polymerase sigma-70 factor, ECF subfamily
LGSAAYIYGVGADVVYAAERFRNDGSQRAFFEPPTERARFERMFDRHHRRLRRLVAGLIADRDRVDDVLQEAYLKAFRGLPGAFANDAHEATWLYRIVYRCCLDELRRRRRRRESPAAEVLVAAVSADAQPRLELEDAFRALAADDRAVLLLVGVVGLDYETAAAILRVPRGTLAWRLSGARARFREVLS